MTNPPPDALRAPKELTPLRRLPSQKRSRERVERMLNCASEVIREQGSDALRMSEVAEMAGVSIGSLYQYFPDKSAIIRTLTERYNEECRHCFEEALAPVRTLEELCAAFSALIDDYYEIFLAEPVIRDVRFGAQADKNLRDIEIAESRLGGAMLAETLQRVRAEGGESAGRAKGRDPEELAAACFYIVHIGEATMRLAISLDRKEGDALVETYKRMALTELMRV